MEKTSGMVRRELLLAFAGGATAQGEMISIAPWRAAGAVFSVTIGEDRWAVLEPVLERRRTQLATLRRFRVAEGVEPLAGATE